MGKVKAEESKINDFEVIKVMVDQGVGIRVSTAIGQVQKGAKGKLGRVTMGLENEHCQEIMADMVHETGKYATMLVVVDMERFNQIKTTILEARSHE